jgi:hypothetical protein
MWLAMQRGCPSCSYHVDNIWVHVAACLLTMTVPAADVAGHVGRS